MKQIKVGDLVYKMCYYSHPFKKSERSFSIRKVKKISYNAIRFVDGESVSLSALNNIVVDGWYTSKKLMYEGKLKAYLEKNEYVLKEIDYLKKKVKEK